MAKKKTKEVKKRRSNEKQEQVLDGLGMDFEEVMKKLANSPKINIDTVKSETP